MSGLVIHTLQIPLLTKSNLKLFNGPATVFQCTHTLSHLPLISRSIISSPWHYKCFATISMGPAMSLYHYLILAIASGEQWRDVRSRVDDSGWWSEHVHPYRWSIFSCSFCIRWTRLEGAAVRWDCDLMYRYEKASFDSITDMSPKDEYCRYSTFTITFTGTNAVSPIWNNALDKI